MAENNYMFVKDSDGLVGRIECDEAGRPVGVRAVMTPSGNWVPYYVDGPVLSEAMALERAKSFGIESPDLYGAVKPIPQGAEDSVEKDPYG